METKDLKGLLWLNLIVGVAILIAVLFGHKEETDPYDIQLISSGSFVMGEEHGKNLLFMYLDSTKQLVDGARIDPDEYEEFEENQNKKDKFYK